MAEDDVWGDLFAKASDLGVTTTTTTTTSSDGDPLGPHKRSREEQGSSNSKDKKRRRQKEKDLFKNDQCYDAMLKRRMLPLKERSYEWPFWIQVNDHMLDLSKCGKHHPCNGWEASFNETGSSTTLHKYEKCKQCGDSAIKHSIQVSVDFQNNSRRWPYALFAAIRNLRCIGSLLSRHYLPGENGNEDDWMALNERTIRGMAHSIMKNSGFVASVKPDVLRTLPPEEAEILLPKMDDILRWCNLILISVPSEKKPRKKKAWMEDVGNGNAVWEPAVRLVTSCDVLYYRLHYLQIAKILSPLVKGEEVYFLPDPLEYFGLPCLTMDVNDWTSELGREGCELLKSEHPLAAIQMIRKHETAQMFDSSGWMTCSNTIKLTKLSLEKTVDDETKHETPAPDVLMQWRDGCRDFICNLYAYATLPSRIIDEVTRFIGDKKSRIDGIVEIGAGTGYIARLLRDREIEVEAWDLQPTSAGASDFNEYHGSTPPFIHVKKHSKLPPKMYVRKALLLCYPPPGSPMAHDTLKAFVESGGKCLVHIGEFRGLTGNRKFESLLTRQFICRYRKHCSTWGTDACHVTIWTYTEDPTGGVGGDTSILLPCSCCEENEAVRRCRLDRTIVYCSERCSQEHAKSLEELLLGQTVMIPQALCYNDNKHFSPL